MAVIRFKLNGGATTPARVLNPGVNRLGRGEDNDIKIDHVSVSWHHCQLELGDGSESCTNHPTVRASWRCTNCQKIVCHTCVHELHLRGKASHKLCPLCSHHCEAILWDDGKGKKKSLWGKLKGVFGK